MKMVKKIKCPQTKCAYNTPLAECRNCEVCDCEPNVINEDCDKCWNCAYDEGILRWEDNQTKSKDEEEVKEKLKPMEIKSK